jgi:hypothetical protein
MFRHTVATALVEHGGPAVAQRVLGHRHVGTTIDAYVHVDRAALVSAMAAFEQRPSPAAGGGARARERYVFHYDPTTLAELEAIARRRIGEVGR